jgi:hypothetical protein
MLLLDFSLVLGIILQALNVKAKGLLTREHRDEQQASIFTGSILALFAPKYQRGVHNLAYLYVSL